MAPLHMFFSLFGLLIAARSAHAGLYYPCSYAGQFIPDDSDCTTYYVCDGDNIGQYFHCDTGLEYSVETSNCVVDGNCNAGSRPPISTTERPPYTGTAPPGIFCTFPGQTYPDPYRCNLFWYCDTGMVATPIDCGSLYYNVYTGTCDYPYDVDCTNGYRPPTTTGTHTISTTETTSRLPTPPVTVHCSGVHDELIPDPYDCSVYWLCFEGTYPIYQDCTGGLYFNVNCGCCDFPANVDCVGGVRPTPTPGTPTIPPWVNCGYPGEHIPDLYDCQVYYVCTEDPPGSSNLYPQYYKCTDYLEFNPITNTCDYPQNVDCEFGTRPTNTPFTTSPLPTAPACISCRFPGDIIPDCYDCTVFYICDGNNVPQYRHCSEGLYYNQDYQNCAPTSTCAWTSPRPTYTAQPTTIPPYVLCSYVGQMVEDRSNCQMYYYCLDLTPPTYTITHECCAPSLLFNDVTTLCDKIDTVVCGSRPNDPFGYCPTK